MPVATIYSLDEYANIPWPAHNSEAQSWFKAFSEKGMHSLIRNVWAEVFIVCDDSCAVPVTLSKPHPKNAYVCSPFSHYITYALKETQKLDPPWLGHLLKAVLGQLGGYLQRGRFEPTVYVNNWLLSTNLYDNWSNGFITQTHEALLARFPDAPIAFRSVDARANPDLMTHLRQLGYEPVFSRFVWYQDPSDRNVYRKKSYLRDGHVFQRSGYHVKHHEAFTTEDYVRAETLYSMLYRKKYSELNPDFSASFLQSQCTQSHLQLRGLIKDGEMDAVYGFYVRNGFGTCPIFGYDTQKAAKLGLYRSLSWLWAEEAKRLNIQIHASSGVGAFKRHRGAVPEIEYNMVYTRHLPAFMRRRWQVLGILARHVAIPLIRKQEL